MTTASILHDLFPVTDTHSTDQPLPTDQRCTKLKLRGARASSPWATRNDEPAGSGATEGSSGTWPSCCPGIPTNVAREATHATAALRHEGAPPHPGGARPALLQPLPRVSVSAVGLHGFPAPFPLLLHPPSVGRHQAQHEGSPCHRLQLHGTATACHPSPTLRGPVPPALLLWPWRWSGCLRDIRGTPSPAILPWRRTRHRARPADGLRAVGGGPRPPGQH